MGGKGHITKVEAGVEVRMMPLLIRNPGQSIDERNRLAKSLEGKFSSDGDPILAD